MSIQHDTQPSYSRWLTEDVFKLIEMVRSDEAIYNPRHKYYFCRPYVENFWREVDLRLRKNPGASLAKWTNLRISFRREYTNYLEEKVPPCWSYFDKMFFLHPFLRNKKQSGPKDIDSHIQEALTQINNISYKPQQSTNVSPVNEYMDQYLTYCEDEQHASSPGVEDIIEEEADNEGNLIKNEIKSECENSQDARENHPMQDSFKDIIVEISDDPHPSPSTSSGLKRADTGNRSLFKRTRLETVGPANNISLVRPLSMASTPSEVNHTAHHSITPTASSSSTHIPANSGNQSLCECKTDSDAMFLMSLLPDIRKLHGRDRGKIKIAFQNILQEFLYPD